MHRRKYRVVWDHRLGKQQVFEAHDHEFAKTGTIVSLVSKTGRVLAMVTAFQFITIEYLEEEDE